MAELFRRGGRMSSNGLKLQQPIDATRLTPEELKKREETWVPAMGCVFLFAVSLFSILNPTMGFFSEPRLVYLEFWPKKKGIWWLGMGFLPGNKGISIFLTAELLQDLHFFHTFAARDLKLTKLNPICGIPR